MNERTFRKISRIAMQGPGLLGGDGRRGGGAARMGGREIVRGPGAVNEHGNSPMAQDVNREDGDDVVRTPDGRSFRSVGVAGVRPALHAVWTFARMTARAVLTTIATVWRLAEALDSALWRGLKLSVWSTARFVSSSARAAGAAFADVFRWLPSCGGRAYAAGSAIVLTLCALWAGDEIRNARAEARSLDTIFRPPFDLDDPIVARVDGRYVHLSWLELFRTRILGNIQDASIIRKLNAEQANLDALSAGSEFALREGDRWLRFWIPALDE